MAEADSDTTASSLDSFDDDLPGFTFHSPISPIFPIFITTDFLFDTDSELDSGSSLDWDSDDSYVNPTSHFDHFVDAIAALEEEVLQARVLYKPLSPPLHAPQIHLLARCESIPTSVHHRFIFLQGVRTIQKPFARSFILTIPFSTVDSQPIPNFLLLC